MKSHFANNVAFFVHPDGTTHLRLIYRANDATEDDITLGWVILPNDIARDLGRRIAQHFALEEQLVEKPTKKRKD